MIEGSDLVSFFGTAQQMANLTIMVKLKLYLRLLRPHHWIKSALVFAPLFFNQHLIFTPLAFSVVLGFLSFSILSSIVYIINDMHDLEKDRLHNVKCNRPLASGEISLLNAKIVVAMLSILLVALLSISSGFDGNLCSFVAVGLLALYLLLNITYSRGLKDVPIVDVTILASGFVIRLLFGAVIIGIKISMWLYLVVIMWAFYMGFGKRRNEIAARKIIEQDNSAIPHFYSHGFLDKNMYVCQTLCIIFYTLWSICPETIEKFNTTAFIYTIPLVFIILLKYSLNVEIGRDADPTSVLLNDKVLLLLCVTYVICAACILYFGSIAA